MSKWKQISKTISLFVVALLCVPMFATAAQSQSNSYRVNEVFFGSGGELNACSGSFCAKQSAGELTVGQTSGNQFRAQGGFNTDREPYLEMIVSSTTTDLGTLSPNATATANATFTVKSYRTNGYVVNNVSDAPTNNGYEIATPNAPTPSQTGTEQFGINLTENTLPIPFGANPTQDPDATFGFGQVTGDYNIPNQYKYGVNDIIAQTFRSSSYTNYTVSYIFNISNVTPGGSYTLRHVMVATSVF